MRAPKLYELTDGAFEFPFLVDRNHKALTSSADNIPILHWPDGSWCLQANAYLLDLYWRGLSRKGRGGTLLAYATNISHLLRYCYSNGRDFIDLTDSEFSLFIRGLSAERRKADPQIAVRDANTVIAIGRNCLEFLSSVARLHGDGQFIGPAGRIRAEEREFEIRESGSRRSTRGLITRYWHHRSFPPPDAKKRRMPVTDENLRSLRGAIAAASGSIFVRKRRYAMVDLLDITGARRYELSHLTVADVKRALNSSPHLLKLVTAKKGGNAEEYRYVPVSTYNLRRLDEYIDKNRAPQVRATCGTANDDGYVFVSENTGKRIGPNTFTQELAILREAAGIQDRLSPQMFRHRFITKLFVSLIEIHKCTNEDEFRRAILDTETMKQKVQQWTGHSNLASLDWYIHLAFTEVANFKKTLEVIDVERLMDSFEAGLDQVTDESSLGESGNDVTGDLRRMITAIREDLTRMRAATAKSTK